MSDLTAMSQYSYFIHQSRYARWLPDEQRRETWEETVKRYFNFFEIHLKTKCGYHVPKEARQKLESMVLAREVMPSMRALMTAGPALERENMAGFNCSYLAIDRQTSFDEILYILMNGTGVGYSVESKYVSKLPTISETFQKTDTVIVVPDSKLGWAKALRELIALLYAGQIPSWDTSRLRPAGAPLKTFGGRSSGPEPLINLFQFTVELFKKNAGRKLSTLDCHDLACKVADTIVVGGVRRSALIALSDLNDDLMRTAKSGQWWIENPQRALANISYVADERPQTGIFMKEWLSLYESKSGERGIFSRLAAYKQCVKTGRRDPNFDWGTNPCSEIILRNRQVCNLTEVIVRASDTEATLRDKVEAATVLGTWQSTLTDFKFLPAVWKKNTEEERLLGVSLTGIWDNPLTYHLPNINENPKLPALLAELKQHTIDTNKQFAKKLGINQSAAITCVKPSGTVSQLVECASGIHPRHSPYYIRTVRMDKKDPLCSFMVDMGFPHEDEQLHPDKTMVFSFPQKSPENAVTKNVLHPIDHLNMWKIYHDYWSEHKPSVTISVEEDQWMEVGHWVFQHFEEISGVSFLPETHHVYLQAPYQACDLTIYDKMMNMMPQVDWSRLCEYEHSDQTVGTQELSCSSGVCELV